MLSVRESCAPGRAQTLSQLKGQVTELFVPPRLGSFVYFFYHPIVPVVRLGNFGSRENTHVRSYFDHRGVRDAMRAETNSNDFGGFGIYLADSNSIFVVVEFFLMIRIFGVFGNQMHAMRLYMCMCCGLFGPTQFHFECCSVRDDSR